MWCKKSLLDYTQKQIKIIDNLKIKTRYLLKGGVGFEKIKIIDGIDEDKELVCKMDNKLLRRILDKKSHWNNSEIGTHISFFRKPNQMEVDLHTSLAFFHL